MSLLAREYALALDDLLVHELTPQERKLAWREIRAIIEDMAFNYAVREKRIPPREEDYVHALAAIKPPGEVQHTFVRRKPVYAKRVKRKRITTWSVLFVLVAFSALAWTFATSEASEAVFSYADGGADLKADTLKPFNVTRPYERLEITANVFSGSFVELMLIDPRGEPVWSQTFGKDRNWAHGSVAAPLEGQYFFRVRFVGTPQANAISAEVRGVYATR